MQSKTNSNFWGGAGRKGRLASASLLLVAIVWGSGFVAVEMALEAGLSVPGMMALRFCIGAAVISLFSFRQVKSAGKRTAQHGVIAGVLLFVAFYAQTAGQSKTTISNTAFLTATNVMMVPFLCWVLQKKRPPVRFFALAGLMLGGVGVLSLRDGGYFSLSAGDAVVLLGAALFAMHIVCLGTLCKCDNASAITFWQLLSVGVLSTLVLLIQPGAGITGVQMRRGLWPILYQGLVSTCLCFFLQTKAQTYVSPAKAGIMLSTEGLFGSLFSVLTGMEPLRLPMVIGGLMITASVVLAEVDVMRLWRERKKELKPTVSLEVNNTTDHNKKA